MNEAMRTQAAHLRQMPSSDAADWLMRNYPADRKAITLLEHVSLRRTDTERLARHYLGGKTWAHDHVYRLFAQRLGLGRLVRILGEAKNRNGFDADLLAYHLRSIPMDDLEPSESKTVTDFLASLTA